MTEYRPVITVPGTGTHQRAGMCTDGDGVSHGTTHSPMTSGLRCPGCGWSAGRIDVAPPLRSLRALPARRGVVESCDIIECELQHRTREEETIDRGRVDIQHLKCELENPVLKRRERRRDREAYYGVDWTGHERSALQPRQECFDRGIGFVIA